MQEYSIAEKLVELRTARGVTQEDVARSLSISNKTVSKWETGASAPDLPMLAALSRYFGVTTDSLLGLAEETRHSTREEVGALFRGLNRPDSVLKAFEVVRALVPVMYGTVSAHRDLPYAPKGGVPAGTVHGYRSQVATPDFFAFTACSEDVNVAVMTLRNRADFAWMKDPCKQQRIVQVFRFLSDGDALSVLYFLHSEACSESFTADYVARNTGLETARAAELLDGFCSVGGCRWVTAHLTEGEVRVYECHGDGLLLSLVSLAFEGMCGRHSYDYNYHGICKMIGGGADEPID